MYRRLDDARMEGMVDRLDAIDRRLSRIEGGLALGGFLVGIALAVLKLHVGG